MHAEKKTTQHMRCQQMAVVSRKHVRIAFLRIPDIFPGPVYAIKAF